MIDKHIHENEFRLRVLVTNQCNKNCSFCLNDFQPKEPELYANPFEAADCIRAYGQFMQSINEESIVTFSGGEPGIYPFLDIVLPYARKYCNVVKMVTNGTAIREKYYKFIDKWHIHVTEKNQFIPYNGLVQYVVTDDTTFDQLNEIVSHYIDAFTEVKLFVDFFSKDKDRLYDMIAKVKGVSTRFTGKQINRGIACKGCDVDCVTLKALWFFPDNTVSTCPQGIKDKLDFDSWDETMDVAYKLHKEMI